MNQVTELRIAADHPAFAGHFPGMPIVPGVVLLDEALNAIVAALGLQPGRCTLTTVKFRGVVRPGQALSLRFESPSPGSVRFAIDADGAAVADGVLSLPAPDAPADGR
jgi:3-hydroxymyristoyl/3-hydroxydecanoyl-(acyl carrier protein) dehydratase